MKKQKKRKLKKSVIYFLLTLFILIFTFSTYKIIKWFADSYNTKKLTQDINETTEVIESEGNEENVININPPENEKDDYWDFIKQPYVSVDFNSLKERNSDTVAWIKVNNSNINYPVVQSTNNEYYLNRAFDQSYSGGGWIYMDYRNNPTSFDTNTIIYGHSMKDKSMFGSLLQARYDYWYTNKDNQVIKLSTPQENTLWRMFSTYTIPAESYYIQNSFNTNEEIESFFNTLKERSVYDFDVDLISSDKILTLSTCNSATTDERLVVHAKLISVEKR